MRGQIYDVCPLLAISSKGSGPCTCLKDRCAWWDRIDEKGCAIVAAVDAIRGVAASLDDMQLDSKCP